MVVRLRLRQDRAGLKPAAATPGTVSATDEELVERYRLGDDDAFEWLVERYGASALRFARYLVRDGHLAEEIAQDAFVKLVGVVRDGGFDPARGRFASFFFRMVRHLSIDRMRARSRGPQIAEDLDPQESVGAPDLLLQKERCAQVREIVATLPERERAAIVLREFDGLSYKEIALALDANIETVKTWIFRARRRIQGSWSEAHAEESRTHGM